MKYPFCIKIVHNNNNNNNHHHHHRHNLIINSTFEKKNCQAFRIRIFFECRISNSIEFDSASRKNFGKSEIDNEIYRAINKINEKKDGVLLPILNFKSMNFLIWKEIFKILLKVPAKFYLNYIFSAYISLT